MATARSTTLGVAGRLAGGRKLLVGPAYVVLFLKLLMA